MTLKSPVGMHLMWPSTRLPQWLPAPMREEALKGAARSRVLIDQAFDDAAAYRAAKSAGTLNGTDARWEAFQIDHLDDEKTFRIETKSRQIAWSWISAAEAVAEAHADLWGDQPRDSIFVSIKTEEAAEKIRYARRIYDSLKERSPIGSSMHRITRDGQLHLEFSNGARLNSLPAVPPRGRARANVYLDEFAHVAQVRR